MYIEKRLLLKDKEYYARIDVEYNNNLQNNNIPTLCLKNCINNYYDGGSLGELISLVQDNYSIEKANEYNKDIGYMADILYIYNRIPFISGIRDDYKDKDGNIYSISYISKEEIDRFIKDNNINMIDNSKFELSNPNSWIE